ncbi:hypothetical protein [Noviherbaspirillum malthae]|uniref:hypothetical protein n=1 Tax=Noviherbaspirillum malthae TaxID=1260987 RepID=UPI00188F3BDE|nr:hypothetical protein [Noviherbaspirillum malthae]
MGIKDFLQKEDEGFISLHDLLIKMTEVDGVSLQNAARALYRVLDRASPTDYPQWQEIDLATGVKPTEDFALALERLRHVAETGKFAPLWDDDDIPF